MHFFKAGSDTVKTLALSHSLSGITELCAVRLSVNDAIPEVLGWRTVGPSHNLMHFFLKVVVLKICLFHFWVRVVKKWWTANVSEMGMCQVPGSICTETRCVRNCTFSVRGRHTCVGHASDIVRLWYAGCFVLSLCLRTGCPHRCFCRGFHFAIGQDKMNKKQQYNLGSIFCVMQINTKNEHSVCKFTAYRCKATSCYPASAGV